MQFFAHLRVLSLALAVIACLHSSYLTRHALGAAAPQGEQRLTQEVFDNFIFYWESLLDLKFTAEEREALKRAVVGYWKTNNTKEIQNTLKQAESGAANREVSEAQLSSMREAYQSSTVAEARKETNDPVAVVLVRAFDRVHGFGGADDQPARMNAQAQGSAPGPESNSFRGYRAGRYEGTALNTTSNQGGRVVFEISNLDPSSGRATWGCSTTKRGTTLAPKRSISMRSRSMTKRSGQVIPYSPIR